MMSDIAPYLALFFVGVTIGIGIAVAVIASLTK